MATKELNENLKELNKKLEWITSKRYLFFSSVLRGLGSAVGATIVVAVLVSVLNRIISELGGVPFLERILEGIR